MASITTEGARLARAWKRSPDKTRTLRDLAAVLVDLRLRCEHDGRPDYAGNSWEYRSTVTALYDEAGVNADERRAIQSAVRYHVGNRLREVVSPADLEAAGMRTLTPRQRVDEHREMVSAAAEVTRAQWGPAGDPARLVASCVTLLEALIRGRGIRAATPRALDSLERSLVRLTAAVAAVDDALTEERERRAQAAT